MDKFYTLFLTLIWVTTSVNGITTPNPRLPVFISTPRKTNYVLVGENLKLEWSFMLRSTRDLDRIVLFGFDLRKNAKRTIAQSVDIKSGVIKYNPFMAGFKDACDITYNSKGIGRASIYIQNVQFSHTYDYGISLKMIDVNEPAVERSVVVKVVDLVRRSIDKNTKVITSWLGHKLLLRCNVVYRSNAKPFFKWYKKSPTTNRFVNLLVPNHTRILVIDKVNDADFGEYMCEAITTMVRVKQKIKVDRLGYARSPRNVGFKYNPLSKSYAVFWEQPSTKGGHWVTKYVLERWNTEKKAWLIHQNITTSHDVTIKNIKKVTRYRICSANEIGYTQSSCSQSIVLGQRLSQEHSIAIDDRTVHSPSTARGKSSQNWASQCHILVLALLSAVLLPR